MRRTVISAVLGGALAASLTVVPSPAVAAEPPPNDDFNNGQVILSKGEVVSGSNVGATEQTSAGEPNHAGATFEGEPLGAVHSVWWSWTATTTGEAKIGTCNSDFDTRLAVYTGDAVGALTPVASALDTNDGSCNSVWAGVTFTAAAGTTYRIAVDTQGSLGGGTTDPTQGNIALALTAPPGGEEPPADDDTNPGTSAAESPYTFTMPRVKLYCDEFGDDVPDDCLSNKSTGLRFWSVEKYQSWTDRLGAVRTWLEKQRAKGADITFVPRPIAANDLPRSIREYLRGPKGRGGEVIYQSITPGARVSTTAADPARLVVQYFEPAVDKAVLAAELARLEKAGEDRKNVSSRCDFIDSDASFDDIERRLGEALGSGLLTQKRAGDILKQFGCGYEVAQYVDGPGLTVDTVLDVVGVDKKRNVIQLKVGLPVRQDLVFVISEEPEFAETSILGLGLDGRLTASTTQVNRLTVQVIERVTGRLVPGVKLDFFDNLGNRVTETTNDKGEWTFTSLMPRAGRFALKASYTGANGASVVGFRSIDVVDRKASYTTMTGRTMSWNGSTYTGTQADVDAARTLQIVPGNLGTGLTGAPTAPSPIRQIQVAVPAGGAFVTGQQNGVHLPNDSNYLVGSSSGLVTIGGGQRIGPSARPVAARAWANPFQQFATWLAEILSGTEEAIETEEGTVAETTSPADRQAISATNSALISNGAIPSGGLISDKGLGLIGQAGGNLIGQAGGNVIATGGLNLRDAAGNLIGQAGGNLISDKGLGRVAHRRATSGLSIGANNVISLESSMMPVYGGNVVARP